MNKKSLSLIIVVVCVALVFGSFLTIYKCQEAKNRKTYTITWVNYDGEVILTEQVEAGTKPVFSGDNPLKPADSFYTYSFSGWLPSIAPASANTTYVAQFEQYMSQLAVQYSHESGFFSQEFELTLSSAKNTKIYYTLDSSTPDANSILYTGPIKIKDNSSNPNVYASKTDISAIDVFTPTNPVDKCVIVKAVGIDNDGNKSQVACKSFFVGYNDKEAYDNLPIVSLVVNPDDLFSYENGIYVTGKTYDEQPHEGYPETYPANYQNKGKEWERKAEFTYFEKDKEFSFTQTIGVRIHGGWSRAFNQKSFNLYARKEYSGTKTFAKPFFDTQKLQTCMLRSGGYRDTFATKARDSLNHTFSKGESFSVQDSFPCVLFLNGEYWGMYLLQERFTENYVEEHYGVDKDNVIIVEKDVIDEGLESDIVFYEELIEFFKNNVFNTDQAYEQAKNVIDVEEFAAYMATELYIGNIDWPVNNVRMWRARTNTGRPYEDGKWHFMMYDTDDSSGMVSNKCSFDSDPFENKNHWKDGPLDTDCILGLMLVKLLDNQQFKRLFIETFTRIGAENFSPQKVNAYLDATTAQVSKQMVLFYSRFVGENPSYYNEQYYFSKVAVIREFFEKRYSYAMTYLNNHVGL